jgi:hypothetical protein
MTAVSIYDEIRKAFEELIIPEFHAIRSDLRPLGEKIDAFQAHLEARIDRLEARLMAKLDALDARPPVKDERGRCQPRGDHRHRRSEGR